MPKTIAAIEPAPRAEPVVDEGFEREAGEAVANEDDTDRDLLDVVVVAGEALDVVRGAGIVVRRLADAVVCDVLDVTTDAMMDA